MDCLTDSYFIFTQNTLVPEKVLVQIIVPE